MDLRYGEDKAVLVGQLIAWSGCLLGALLSSLWPIGVGVVVFLVLAIPVASWVQNRRFKIEDELLFQRWQEMLSGRGSVSEGDG